MSKPNDLEIHPETLWQEKLRFWPSAVLAELVIRIKGELNQRVEAYRREAPLFRKQSLDPEQK